jgi:Family of unknown function (DUF5829)
VTETLRLNHLYRVVDAETFAAARDSAWLHEVFAPAELRTTRRPDWEYTGLYWYGRSTYLELFESGAQGPHGASGVAFAVETPGASSAVASAWRDALGTAEHRLVVRPVADEAVPWFHIAHAVPDQQGGLKLWSMEYHAHFLAAWHPTRTTARGITRAEVLERYASVVAAPASPLLDDVVAVTMALTPGERGFFESHAAAFDVQRRDAGTSQVLAGEGITFGLVDATDDRHGVQEIVCRLRRPAGRNVITIGRSTITVDGDRMVWRFR